MKVQGDRLNNEPYFGLKIMGTDDIQFNWV